MTLLKVTRESSVHFTLHVKGKQGKERWLYEVIKSKSGTSYIQTGKENG